jgi:hypothetical protein
MHTGFWWKYLREADHLEGSDRWEDTIKMDLEEMGSGMDWIDRAQDRDRWRALVNAVMNIRAP